MEDDVDDEDDEVDDDDEKTELIGSRWGLDGDQIGTRQGTRQGLNNVNARRYSRTMIKLIIEHTGVDLGETVDKRT